MKLRRSAMMSDRIDLAELMDKGLLLCEDDETYHSRSRRGEVISSHKLIEFRESPYKYIRGVMEPSDDVARPDALRFGSAFHALLLEGDDAFRDRYPVVAPPINQKTGEPYGKTTKAYIGHYAMYREHYVTPDEELMMLRMHDAFWSDSTSCEVAVRLLTETPNAVEAVFRQEIEGVMCQIKCDMLTSSAIVDLKTCADISRFERDAFAYGYPTQLAFYRDMIERVTGVRLPVYIIAVEKSECPVSGIWKVDEELLDDETVLNHAALREVKRCRETGSWSTGYETVRVLRKRKQDN